MIPIPTNPIVIAIFAEKQGTSRAGVKSTEAEDQGSGIWTTHTASGMTYLQVWTGLTCRQGTPHALGRAGTKDILRVLAPPMI